MRQAASRQSVSPVSARHVSPLARSAARLPVPGVRFATCEAGIRYKGRTDLMLAVLDAGHDRGRRAHPLQDLLGTGAVVPRGLDKGKARALVVNSGNANAFTGKKGAEAVAHHGRGRGQGGRLRARARSSSPRPASSASRSMPASSRICSTGSPRRPKPDAWQAAARAIMTTDTFPKLATRTVRHRRRRGRRSTASARAPA